MQPGSQQLAEFPSVCTSHTPSPAASQGLRPTIRDFVCAINGSVGNSCWSRCRDRQSPALERNLLLVGASCRDSVPKWEGEFFLKATEWAKCGLDHRHIGVNQSDGPAGCPHNHSRAECPSQSLECSHLSSLSTKELSLCLQTQNFLREHSARRTLRPTPDLWNPSLLKFLQVFRKG